MLPLTSRCLSTLLALYALTPAALSNKPTSPTSRHNVYNYNTFNAGPNKEMKKLLLEIKTQLTDLQKTVNGIQGTKPIGKGEYLNFFFLLTVRGSVIIYCRGWVGEILVESQ